jgi:hypothetical protein
VAGRAAAIEAQPATPTCGQLRAAVPTLTSTLGANRQREAVYPAWRPRSDQRPDGRAAADQDDLHLPDGIAQEPSRRLPVCSKEVLEAIVSQVEGREAAGAQRVAGRLRPVHPDLAGHDEGKAHPIRVRDGAPQRAA